MDRALPGAPARAGNVLIGFVERSWLAGTRWCAG